MSNSFSGERNGVCTSFCTESGTATVCVLFFICSELEGAWSGRLLLVSDDLVEYMLSLAPFHCDSAEKATGTDTGAGSL